MEVPPAPPRPARVVVNTLFFQKPNTGDTIECNMEYDRAVPNTLAVAPAPYCMFKTTTVFTTDGIPFSFEYGFGDIGESITVKCLADTNALWACLITFKERNFVRHAVLTSFNPSIAFRATSLLCHITKGFWRHTPFSLKVRKWFDHRVELPKEIEEHKIPLDGVLEIHDEQLKINKNLLAHRSKYFEAIFDLSPNYSPYNIHSGKPGDIKNFVRLAYRDPQFELSGANIEELLRLSMQFKADECFLECLDFYMRTGNLEKIDVAIHMERYPQHHAFRTLCGQQAALQLIKDGTTRWENDFRVISKTLIGEMSRENLPPEMNVCVAFKVLSMSEIVNATEPWTFNGQLSTDGKYWNVKVNVEWRDGKLVPWISTDETVPWFVEANIQLRVFQKNNNTVDVRRTFHGTSVTGGQKYLIKTEINPEETESVHFIINVTRAMLFDIPLTSPDFTKPNRFTNFKINVVNEANGLVEKKEFFVIKEIITGSSQYFQAMNSDRWAHNSRECTLKNLEVDFLEVFLKLAYNPRILINDMNVITFLNVALYFGMHYMIERIKKYLNGYDVSPETKNNVIRKYNGIIRFWKGDLPLELTEPPTDEQIETWYKTSAQPSEQAVDWMEFWRKVTKAVRDADEKNAKENYPSIFTL